MAETTHQVNGKITGKEHFEQVTKNAKPRELSLPERVARLEHTVFPHMKPGTDLEPETDEADRD